MKLVGAEPVRADVTEVASCTAAASHRRDHDHRGSAECCHPHAVEVIHLGQRAIAVCHDCRADSGFVPDDQALHLAQWHREETRDVSVPLPRVAPP